ncbi:hypothetical protein SAMN02745244_02080 [Tessaracoccus bendigoensis DSM 12906]|uniref:Uncharacterized protein n=1 Tax=Tessaracoccus bendigoensis DSM 12906 TaxID=1123357 RepID=A0A1M6HVR4_9ACTN|nr:hypothetical protein [Tessaracoccus bendigoensis]SHJ26306.1 hypothetical protein SAMN02745244_02080 [Tessaracoccus bendigoensis DSM 12906]
MMWGPEFERSLDMLADNVTRSLDGMSQPSKPRKMTESQRQEMAGMIEGILAALPEDQDDPLRARLLAYVAGLRGEFPELPNG